MQTCFPMRNIKRFSFFTLFLAAVLVGGGSMTVNAVVGEGTPQGIILPKNWTGG